MYKALIIAVSVAALFSACNSSTTKKQGNKFGDAEIIRIYQLSDERKAEPLRDYLKSDNATYRLEAAYAFASIEDSTSIGSLEEILTDPDPAVRAAAAYALGQYAGLETAKDIINAFQQEKNDSTKYDQLEAIGKIGATALGKSTAPEKTEFLISFLTQVKPVEEGERNGWARAVLRLHMAGLTDMRLMNRMSYILQTAGNASKVTCAQAMARFRGAAWFEDPDNKSYVVKWCKVERNSDVRVSLVSIIGKINDADAKTTLLSYLAGGYQEQAVKIAALRGAKYMDIMKAADLIPVLDDKDDYVVLECLQLLESKNTKDDVAAIRAKCDQRIPQIRAGAMRLQAKNGVAGIDTEIWNAFNSSSSIYEKVHYAHAIGVVKTYSDQVFHALMNEKEYAIKYALTEALIEMHPGNLNTLLLDAFDQGDVGVQALTAGALRDEQYNDEIQKRIETSFKAALAKLALPREIETYNEIVRTYNSHNASGEELQEKTYEYNHPVDWKMVASIPANQQAKITTSKGVFTIDLKVEDAPSSVLSFITLAREGFYDGKYFHRVIPNFVIQGGCPRGDGMGGTDYSLRSEFRLHDYKAGAVGLASSGKDTESCQWFVTHVATPNLEGRYTIFGYVSSGMEVVRSILVGDRIEKVEIL